MPLRQDASTGEISGEADASASDKPTMQVKVYAPFQVYYEGPALSVSGVNGTGQFDILPKHHNFICTLEPCSVVVRTPFDEVKNIKVSMALMHVKADRVVVFVDV